MGLKLPRKKWRNYKLSLAYKLVKFIPINAKRKLKLLLDLSWIFTRLAHEQTFKSGISLPMDNENDILTSVIEENSSVLDIGCGKGYVMKRILPKTKNITGIDNNQATILTAQKEFAGTGIRFFCEDIDSYLKRSSIQFDYVILSNILEHIDDPEGLLLVLRDRCKYIYIEVPDFEASYLNLYRREVKTDLIYTDADHVSEFDRQELEAIITSCQLRILKRRIQAWSNKILVQMPGIADIKSIMEPENCMNVDFS